MWSELAIRLVRLREPQTFVSEKAKDNHSILSILVMDFTIDFHFLLAECTPSLLGINDLRELPPQLDQMNSFIALINTQKHKSATTNKGTIREGHLVPTYHHSYSSQ